MVVIEGDNREGTAARRAAATGIHALTSAATNWREMEFRDEQEGVPK
jgi:hypothetical protein